MVGVQEGLPAYTVYRNILVAEAAACTQDKVREYGTSAHQRAVPIVADMAGQRTEVAVAVDMWGMHPEGILRGTVQAKGRVWNAEQHKALHQEGRKAAEAEDRRTQHNRLRRQAAEQREAAVLVAAFQVAVVPGEVMRHWACNTSLEPVSWVAYTEYHTESGIVVEGVGAEVIYVSKSHAIGEKR